MAGPAAAEVYRYMQKIRSVLVTGILAVTATLTAAAPAHAAGVTPGEYVALRRGRRCWCSVTRGWSTRAPAAAARSASAP
ncbi:hypothetical protein JCM9534A_64280 [Catenuloplanes indicus JCM 9534]